MVLTARGQGLAIGTKDHAQHGVGLAGERFIQLLVARHVPQADGVVATAGGQGCAIGLKATLVTLPTWPVRG